MGSSGHFSGQSINIDNDGDDVDNANSDKGEATMAPCSLLNSGSHTTTSATVVFLASARERELERWRQSLLVTGGL